MAGRFVSNSRKLPCRQNSGTPSFRSPREKSDFLYHPGCHLCEIAAHLIVQLRSVSEISLVEIDIATDERLVARYGTKIPVVRRDDTLQELDWPFTLDELKRFAAR